MNARAFATPAESKLVDALRSLASPLFSPVSLDSKPGLRVKQCKAQGVAAVVVLGHPDYYPKFVFVPSR